MFDLLFSPRKAQRHPFEIFFIGIVYSSIAILFSLWVFPNYISIAFVFLTVFSCLYLVQGAIKIEEKKETKYKTEKWILKKHSKLVILILALFLGYIISFSIWSFALPLDKATQIFGFQKSTLEGIQSMIATGSFDKMGAFSAILSNNIKVLIISLVFAIFFGAGAIYVLVWNASVMGFVIGDLARQTIGAAALPLAFTKYFIHGIPEMLAYLITALAGGILYSAMIRGDLTVSEKKKKIFLDILTLIIISIVLLVIAAVIETNISPYI